MKLLITGGSGYVGAAILKRAPTDWQIAATYLAHPIEQTGVAAFHIDVRDVNAVQRLFDEIHPDVVIHTAALMSGNEMMAANADGSRNIARVAAQSFGSAPSTDAQGAPLRTRLVHISSDVIFDGEHAPYDESAPPNPITPYAESKARAEEFVRAEYTNPVIVRTSLIYGFDPLDPRTRQTLNGEMPRLFTDEYRCPIFVDDLADALIEIAAETLKVSSANQDTIQAKISAQTSDPVGAKPLGSILNVAGPQRLSRYEFGVKIAKAYHTTPKFKPAVSASFPTPRPRDCTLDIALAQKILRTRLRSVDQVLAKWLEPQGNV